jgi:hypothetical protein
LIPFCTALPLSTITIPDICTTFAQLQTNDLLLYSVASLWTYGSFNRRHSGFVSILLYIKELGSLVIDGDIGGNIDKYIKELQVMMFPFLLMEDSDIHMFYLLVHGWSYYGTVT